MALSTLRCLSRTVRTPSKLPSLASILIRHNSEQVTPYRPWPLDDYMWPGSAKYFLPQAPVVKNEQEEYEEEYIYLDELEDRMKLYDKKYKMPDEMKSLWNEFGHEDVDDRAFATYGQSFLSDPEDIKRFGRGKKINPAHYINPGWNMINRNPLSI